MELSILLKSSSSSSVWRTLSSSELSLVEGGDLFLGFAVLHLPSPGREGAVLETRGGCCGEEGEEGKKGRWRRSRDGKTARTSAGGRLGAQGFGKSSRPENCCPRWTRRVEVFDGGEETSRRSQIRGGMLSLETRRPLSCFEDPPSTTVPPSQTTTCRYQPCRRRGRRWRRNIDVLALLSDRGEDEEQTAEGWVEFVSCVWESVCGGRSAQVHVKSYL